MGKRQKKLRGGLKFSVDFNSCFNVIPSEVEESFHFIVYKDPSAPLRSGRDDRRREGLL